MLRCWEFVEEWDDLQNPFKEPVDKLIFDK